MWIFAGYILLALCVIFFSARLGYYVDLLDQKTTLASAFIGGVMLAAVTSLPELFTSITSVAAVGKPALVVGNILGSDLFNSFVLGGVFLLWFRGLRSARVTRSHGTTAICVLIVYGILGATCLSGRSLLLVGVSAISLVIIALYVFSIKTMSTTAICVLIVYGILGATCLSGRSLLLVGVSAISLVIIALYVFSIKTMSGDDDTGDSEDVSPLRLPQVVARFVFYAVLLVAASILITYASDYIGETLGLGTTLAGALLLGIVTSLPEMISCFVLARIGNFNAMVGNIVGSNMFNFMILCVADAVYWNKDLYVYDMQGRLLLITGVISAAAVCVLTLLLARTNPGEKRRPAVPVAKDLYVYDMQGRLLLITGVISAAAVCVLTLLLARTNPGEKRRPAVPVALLSVVPVVCYAAFVVLSA